METAALLVGNRQAGAGIIPFVKVVFLALAIGPALGLTSFGEDTSAQRLESAQQGIADGSWPRKPDNRLSPLSGRMKESQEVSVRYYGKEKEIRGKSADGWLKGASVGSKANWEGASVHPWEPARWGQERDWVLGRGEIEKFQPQKDLASERPVTMRQLDRQTAEGWSSRAVRMGGGREGSLRMYEGRLTRVRQQVWQESEEARDLGAGRQEKFSPAEVEKILSQPVGELRRGS